MGTASVLHVDITTLPLRLSGPLGCRGHYGGWDGIVCLSQLRHWLVAIPGQSTVTANVYKSV
jgi:hypothetical protein